MGFFGLNHYGDSDEAWDFWYDIQKAKGNKPKIKKLIAKELRNHTNEFNTDGFINIALYLESEGEKIDTSLSFSHDDECKFDNYTAVISHLITQAQYKTIKAYLNDVLNDKEWDSDLKKDFRRMLKSVEAAWMPQPTLACARMLKCVEAKRRKQLKGKK
jgi:hypothetical protein